MGLNMLGNVDKFVGCLRLRHSSEAAVFGIN